MANPTVGKFQLMGEEIKKLIRVLHRPKPHAPVVTRTSRAEDLINNRLQSTGTASSAAVSHSNRRKNFRKWTRQLPVPEYITDKAFYSTVVKTMHIQSGPDTADSLSTSSHTQEPTNAADSMDVDDEAIVEGVSAQPNESDASAMEVDEGAREPNAEEPSNPLKRKKSWDSEGESELDSNGEFGGFSGSGADLGDESSAEEDTDDASEEGKRRLRPPKPPKSEEQTAEQEPAVSGKRRTRKKGARSTKSREEKKRITPWLDDTFDAEVSIFPLHKNKYPIMTVE